MFLAKNTKDIQKSTPEPHLIHKHFITNSGSNQRAHFRVISRLHLTFKRNNYHPRNTPSSLSRLILTTKARDVPIVLYDHANHTRGGPSPHEDSLYPRIATPSGLLAWSTAVQSLSLTPSDHLGLKHETLPLVCMAMQTQPGGGFTPPVPHEDSLCPGILISIAHLP